MTDVGYESVSWMDAKEGDYCIEMWVNRGNPVFDGSYFWTQYLRLDGIVNNFRWWEKTTKRVLPEWSTYVEKTEGEVLYRVSVMLWGSARVITTGVLK